MREYIEVSTFKDKIECIEKILKSAKVIDRQSLQNLPRMGHFCGIDVYQFVNEITEIIDGWDVILAVSTISEEEE